MAQTDFSQVMLDPNMINGGILAVFMAFLGVVIVGSLLMYVYFALAMMFTAKKLKTEPAWLAWIPIGNLVLMAKMAKMPAWPVWFAIGFLIPMLNGLVALFFTVMGIIWTWKICESRGRPGWWAVLVLVPIIGWIWGLVLWGMLAWGK